jgi:endogenous inhibitor of DNA gyrase (YacG/DUF329 family)
MNMKLVFCLTGLLLLGGCDHKAPVLPFFWCPSADTVHDFPWIDDLIKTYPNCSGICKLIIYKGWYKDQVVIYYDFTGAACDTAGPIDLYNCAGIKVRTFSIPSDFADRNANLLEESIIYKCI